MRAADGRPAQKTGYRAAQRVVGQASVNEILIGLRGPVSPTRLGQPGMVT
jgi:hypothetical protein